MRSVIVVSAGLGWVLGVLSSGVLDLIVKLTCDYGTDGLPACGTVGPMRVMRYVVCGYVVGAKL